MFKKKYYLFFLMFFALLNKTYAQKTIEYEYDSVVTKSILSTIEINGTELEQILKNTKLNKNEKIKIADSVLENHHNFYPPILFAASRVFYDAKRPYDACFLFYLAQVKTKVDVNLNADSSVYKTYISLSKVYNVAINNFSRANRDSAIAIVQRVLDIVDNNIGNYDHRWLSFHSSKIVRTTDKSTLTESDLIKPKEMWQSIKASTLNNYYATFMQFINAEDLDKL